MRAAPRPWSSPPACLAEVCVALPSCAQVYHLPSKEASDALGISLSRLKRICRENQVLRWPHRKLTSLMNLRETITNDVHMKPPEKEVGSSGCAHSPLAVCAPTQIAPPPVPCTDSMGGGGGCMHSGMPRPSPSALACSSQRRLVADWRPAHV